MTAGDLKLAMECIGALGLCDTSHSAPLDTNWDDVTGNTGGAKHTLLEAIKWPRMQWRAFEALGLQPPGGCCSTARQGA